MRIPILVLSLLLVAGLLASDASAAPTLRISDGTSTVTVVDGSGLDGLPGIAGMVSYSGSLGSGNDLWVSVTTGVTKPKQGSASVPYLDLNSIEVSSANGGTLTIEFSDTGFTDSGYPGFFVNIGGTTGGSVALETFADTADSIFGTGSAMHDLGPYSSGAFSEDEAPYIIGSFSSSYSLTIKATVTHSGSSTTSFDAEMYPVPEPTTLVLLGAGLVGVAFLRRRRKSA